jgi:hypothetical protein
MRGQLHALCGEPIDIRRADLFLAEGANVTPAQVIAQDEDDIWPFCERSRGAKKKEDGEPEHASAGFASRATDSILKSSTANFRFAIVRRRL